MKKGLTLIEVIFFITIFGMIAISLVSRLSEKRKEEEKKYLQEYNHKHKEINSSVKENDEILKMIKLLHSEKEK